MQITDTVLMVRPSSFAFNEETAANNYFQSKPRGELSSIRQKALDEFDKMVALLKDHGINVLAIDDTANPPKPDAVFPNNWFCANHNRLSVFPMFAKSRRAEKRADLIEQLSGQFLVNEVSDWSSFENKEMFLEGTGSMVMDHENKMVYACISPRTNKELVDRYADSIGYLAVTFHAHDDKGRPVYHTNVMMSIGEGFAVICSDAISSEQERNMVTGKFNSSGLEIISITLQQMNAFAGNLLQLKNSKDERFIVMSETAYKSLGNDLIFSLERYGKILPVNVSTIEQVEGGSVRCMMAEIFLQPRV